MLKPLSKVILTLAGGLILLVGFLAPLINSTEATKAAETGLRFVDKNSQPLTPAVRVLCYITDSNSARPTDLILKTNNAGQPIHDLPADCNYIAALYLLHQQPAGKPNHGPAYEVYATSWQPGTHDVVQPTGTIIVTDEWPLTLFNIVASLEWQPAPTSTYLDNLWAGLFETSAYLYDLTDGQMAFGPITIYTGGTYWQSADLRFLAANDYRPTAFVGGIVPTPTVYISPNGTSTTYAPGAVYLGRFWDGQDAFNPETGNWSQKSAYTTLGHEWAHYALFLYDEYQETGSDGGASLYCTCPGLPEEECDASAMAYHYTAKELWHSLVHTQSLEICQSTDQWRVHGQSDWDTLTRWSNIQGVQTEWIITSTELSTNLNLGLAGDLFASTASFHQLYLPIILRDGLPSAFPVAEISPSQASAAIEPTIRLFASDVFSAETLNAFYPQVYVVDDATSASPARVVYQGTTTGTRLALINDSFLGEITLFSIHPTSQVRAFADRYSTADEVGTITAGDRYVYTPSADPPLNGQVLSLEADPWQASLDVSYDMVESRLTTMNLTLFSPIPLTTTPLAQFCVPDANIGCSTAPHWQKPMQDAGTFTWTVTFAAEPNSELPNFGTLRVQAPGAGELIRWYQQAGGVGPAHGGAHAPLRDGPVAIDLLDLLPLEGERNRVIFMPAANYNALVAPLPITISHLVDIPLDIDILLPGLDSNPHDIMLTLFHRNRQNTVAPIPETICDPQVLYFDHQLNVWLIITKSGDSEQLNWASGVRQLTEGGIFALGWSNDACP